MSLPGCHHFQLVFQFFFFVFHAAVSGQSFYVTFHGDVIGYDNVAIYSLDGLYKGDLLFSEEGHNSLRGLVSNGTHIFLCSSKDNTILVTRGCHNRITVFSNSSKLSHPYGIAYDSTLDRLYISNQDGNKVVWFPSSSSSALKVFNETVLNPRGIAVDPKTSNVYVASRDNKMVIGFNSRGTPISQFPADLPIGIHINDGVMYVSDRGVAPSVTSYSLLTGQPLKVFPITDSHPSGITTYEGKLYVLGQTTKALYSYDLTTGTPLGLITTFNSDYPEQILVGNC